MFRVEVVSSDGDKCGVPVQVDDHPGETRPYVLNAIADTLLIDRDEIRRVLEEGTEEGLRRHLSRYTKDQLKPLRFRQEPVERLPFFTED